MITPALRDARHSLHSSERIWPESNCYVDLWIGLLHKLGLDPTPMLLCAIDSRFEVDQWTFCKPNAFELNTLYGIRLEELNLWRETLSHVYAQVKAGRVVLLETDGFYLPDTEATTYQRTHGKTTIGVLRIDLENQELFYLHNASSHTLGGEDFEGVFASGVTSASLPPFAEFADVNSAEVLETGALRKRSVTLAQNRLSANQSSVAPRYAFEAWHEHAQQQLNQLATDDLEYFHAWAFATVRQAGSMADLLSHWCQWMGTRETWQRASQLFAEVAQIMAAQQFRLARVPGGGRRPDFGSALLRCSPLWSEAHSLIRIELELPAPLRSTSWWTSTRVVTR